MEAYDAVLRGRDFLNRFNRTANSQARALFQRAIELDSGYSSAYIGLGRVELNAVLQGWTADANAAVQRAESLGQKAIAIDPANAGAHAMLGSVYIRYAEYDRALNEMRRAIELNSSDPDAYAGMGEAQLWSGDIDSAIKFYETARQLGLSVTTKEAITLGTAYVLADRNEDAIRTLESFSERGHTEAYSNAILAAAYAQAGRQADAARQAETVRKQNPHFDIAVQGTLLRKPEQRAKLVAALRKAGL